MMSDEIMVVSAGNSLKNLFQKPERAISVKKVFLVVTGIVLLVLFVLAFLFHYFFGGQL